MDDRMAFIFYPFRFQINSGSEIVRITDNADEIFNHIRCCLFWNANYSTVILHSHKNITTKPVQESADSLIGIVSNPISATFELHCYGFSYCENRLQCIYIHYH